MPVVRMFRGKKVKRTKKVGNQVYVTLQSPEKGLPGRVLKISLDDFLAERKARFMFSGDQTTYRAPGKS